MQLLLQLIGRDLNALTPKKGKLPETSFSLKHSSASPEMLQQFSNHLASQQPPLKPLLKMFETIQHFFNFSNQAQGEVQAPQAQAIALGFSSNGSIELLDGTLNFLAIFTRAEDSRRLMESIEDDSVSVLQNLYKACARILEEEWNSMESSTSTPSVVAKKKGINTLLSMKKKEKK